MSDRDSLCTRLFGVAIVVVILLLGLVLFVLVELQGRVTSISIRFVQVEDSLAEIHADLAVHILRAKRVTLQNGTVFQAQIGASLEVTVAHGLLRIRTRRGSSSGAEHVTEDFVPLVQVAQIETWPLGSRPR